MNNFVLTGLMPNRCRDYCHSLFRPCILISIMSKKYYLNEGQAITRRIVSRINVPIIVHMGAGRSLSTLETIAKTGALSIGTSTLRDIVKVQEICKDKLTVIGNQNGCDMHNWTREMTDKIIKNTIAKADPGGEIITEKFHGRFLMSLQVGYRKRYKSEKNIL